MNAWIEQIFASPLARRGGPVRRNVSSVHKYASLAELKRAARRHEFILMKSGSQYVLFGRTRFKIIPL